MTKLLLHEVEVLAYYIFIFIMWRLSLDITKHLQHDDVRKKFEQRSYNHECGNELINRRHSVHCIGNSIYIYILFKV